MNRIETVVVNNPIRALSQHVIEAPLLLRHGGRMSGGTALELGCGRGEGIRLILDRFRADRVVGIDLDESQVERAHARLKPRHTGRAELRVGDAERLEFADAHFDAVFDFGIIHHIPNWQAALAETRRVLKVGGRFYFVEVLRPFIDLKLARALFDHPRDRFSSSEFLEACQQSGLEPGGRVTNLGSWFNVGVCIRTQ